MKLRRYRVEVSLVDEEGEVVRNRDRRFLTERGASKWCKRWINAAKAANMDLDDTETVGDPVTAVMQQFKRPE